MIPGIDVSDFQGQVDWASVAHSGRRFAFAKATEGTDFVCQTFKANWAGIRSAGLARGAYHFARPNQNQPEAEADWFLRNVGPLEAGDILVLDLEAGDGDLSSWALAWLNRVTDKVGFRPLLYSGTWFLEPRGCTGNGELGKHGLWLASFGATMPAPPASWSFVAFWQHTDGASVPGVAGKCDESFFNGDLPSLQRYGKPSTSAEPTSAGPIPPAPSPPASAPGAGDYVVRSGDTLTAIAAACQCSLQDLLSANPQIVNANLISVGDVVHLPAPPAKPPSAASTYVVQSGDSLSAIAGRLGVSLLALERANPQITNPSLISPGEVVNVPAA